jgi:hypothetical protein
MRSTRRIHMIKMRDERDDTGNDEGGYMGLRWSLRRI